MLLFFIIFFRINFSPHPFITLSYKTFLSFLVSCLFFFFFFQLILCIRIYNCTFSKYIYNCTIADWNSQKTFSNFNPNIALLIDIYIVISLVVLTSISPLTLRLEQISKFHVKQQWEEVASEFGIVIVFCKRIQTSWCGNSYIILLLQSNKIKTLQIETNNSPKKGEK